MSLFSASSHSAENTPSTTAASAPATSSPDIDHEAYSSEIISPETTHAGQSASGMSFSQNSSPPWVGLETSPVQSTYRSSQSIQSDNELDLYGPLDIRGSVKSGGSINFDGDFIVKDTIDAYGGINIKGNIRSEGRIKAYGNIDLNGCLLAKDKVKGYGKLRVVGTLEGKELEIYGNLSVNGRLHCKRLVLYGSLTLIGPGSSYHVENSEEVAGAILKRDQEADWDW
ncbi:unnamed protein product [Clonostachys rosea]|uniref:Polymer-forming cytoskeletal protein n=1 Tax=Bionectria ochroleuca TaxID=29856 RepID=A0ABY6TT93_BIOOC|nr:unnamed protein product [Clonostachys rosea]